MKVEVYATRATAHAALADPLRLAIVDTLAWSDRSPTSLVDDLRVPSNLLAYHLGVLEDAGLVERARSAGDGRRRYVRLRPDAIASLAGPLEAVVADSVLFVCTANSARSQLGAALWNARSAVPASSAGTRPAKRVRPQAVAAGRRAGLDLRQAATRSIDELPQRADLVITVCDIAHEELATLADGTRVLHWSIADPVVDGSAAAFDRTVRELDARVGALAPHVRSDRPRRRTHPWTSPIP